MVTDAPSLEELLFVTTHLRDRDIIELAATRDVDPNEIAADAFSSRWKALAYDRHGRPALAIGARPAHKGVVAVWGFGTPAYKYAAVVMTKYVKAYMIPSLIAAGNYRAQCLVHPQNKKSQQWLESLGFYREANLRRFGNGTDMQLFAWVLDDHSQRSS